MRRLIPILFVAGLLCASSCRKRVPPPAPPPPPAKAAIQEPPPLPRPRIEFGGPSELCRGRQAELKWTTEYADRVEINEGIGAVAPSGSRRIEPTEPTTYVISASGRGGSASERLHVQVESCATASIGQRPVTTQVDRLQRLVLPPNSELPGTPGATRSATDQAIDRLKPGAYAFRPGTLQVAAHADASLIVDPAPVFARSSAEYDKAIAAGGMPGRLTRFAETMEAQLSATPGIRITPVGEARQNLSFERPNEWLWDVEALTPGEHVITLILYALTPVRGVPTLVRVPPFPHRERVTAQPIAPPILPAMPEATPSPGTLSAGQLERNPAKAASTTPSRQSPLLLGGGIGGAALALLVFLLVRRRKPKVAVVTPLTGKVSCFLSYSRIDTDFVLRLRADLEAHGVDCWLDTDDLPGGARWMQQIPSAIEASHFFLVAVTPNSAGSKYVSREIAWADNRGKKIIPLLVHPDSQLPFVLQDYQWIDMRRDYAEAFTKLLRDLGIAKAAAPSAQAG